MPWNLKIQINSKSPVVQLRLGLYWRDTYVIQMFEVTCHIFHFCFTYFYEYVPNIQLFPINFIHIS